MKNKETGKLDKEKSQKKKNQKWIKPRHKIITFVVKIFAIPIFYLLGFRWKKLPKNKKPYLIFYNHQTVWDQFILAAMSVKKTYFVMSDDLSSLKILSPLLNWALHPIPYKKASTDFTILRNLKQVTSEGGSVAISPEGNRTYSGKTEYINPTGIKMMKFLKLPVAIVRIESGYGVFPRWANKRRKGKIYCKPYKIYEYEDYKDIPEQELYEKICKDLFIDESTPSGPFKSRKKAECLERVIYRCPNCGITHFKSKGNVLECTTCNLKLVYNEYKQFEYLDKTITKPVPFKNVNEWYEYQKSELYKMSLLDIPNDKTLFTDKCIYAEVQFRKKKNVISKDANLSFYSDRLEVEYGERKDIYYFSNISSTGVFGKNKFNIYIDKKIYQFKYDDSFNAMKYVNFIYKYKIEKGEEKDDKFLGL